MRGARVAALLPLAACLAGCLFSKPALVTQSFSFVPQDGRTNVHAALSRVLDLRRVVVEPPFDSQSFIYRTGDYAFERDPYAQFLVPPAENLGSALRSYLRRGGLFREVSEPGSLLTADNVLEVYVDKLYGDFRDPRAPAAVLSVRLVLFGERPNSRPRRILEREYTRRVPLERRTAAALMAGWNEALGRIATAITSDIEQQLQQAAMSFTPAEAPSDARTEALTQNGFGEYSALSPAGSAVFGGKAEH